MPKLKTHRATAKRVRVTKSGKIKRGQAFHGHKMSGKSGNRRRRLGKRIIAAPGDAKRLLRLLCLR